MGGRGGESGEGGGSFAGGADAAEDRDPERHPHEVDPADEHYQATVRINRWLDGEYPGRESEWNGKLRVVPDEEMVGGALASFGWDGTISIESSHADRHYRRDPTLLHELLHGRSVGADDPIYYRMMRGWEEGVVESITRLKRARMMRDTGAGDNVLEGVWEVSDQYTYQRYVDSLERLREAAGQADAESFYDELLSTPLPARAGLVRDKAHQAIRAGEGSERDKRWAMNDFEELWVEMDAILRDRA